MSEVQARLVVQQGPDPGDAFILAQGRATIGRSGNNDITIDDPEISRQHAVFIREGEGYAVQDLGSTNGTFVNYQRITGLVPLNHGDVIGFGEAILLTYWDESATDSQPIPVTSTPKSPPVTAIPFTPDPSPPEQPLFEDDDFFEPPAQRRRWLIGCSLAFLLVICLCAAGLFFLDSYQQGRLLYCGGLRPFWELLLGPFGFNPPC